jgi:hypothetical protein
MIPSSGKHKGAGTPRSPAPCFASQIFVIRHSSFVISTGGEIDSVEAQPERPYTREELRAYLGSTRRKCHATLVALTDEQARRPVEYPWTRGQPISFLELQLRNLRHVQEHAAQLCLFLGQHGIPDADLASPARAQDAPGGI